MYIVYDNQDPLNVLQPTVAQHSQFSNSNNGNSIISDDSNNSYRSSNNNSNNISNNSSNSNVNGTINNSVDAATNSDNNSEINEDESSSNSISKDINPHINNYHLCKLSHIKIITTPLYSKENIGKKVCNVFWIASL